MCQNPAITSRQFSEGLATWPFTEALAKRLDRLQSFLLAGCLRFCRRTHELEENYFRRRSIFAGKACKKHGLWSYLFAGNIVNWHSRCLRASTRAFFGNVITFMTEQYFAEQRRSHTIGKKVMTKTRCLQGHVALRLHDSVSNARQRIGQAGLGKEFMQAADLMFDAEVVSEAAITSVYHRDVVELATQEFELLSTSSLCMPPGLFEFNG